MSMRSSTTRKCSDTAIAAHALRTEGFPATSQMQTVIAGDALMSEGFIPLARCKLELV